ncbi:MAG: hypothetical protein AAGC55_17640 [Myxococcota bacterium]
MATITLSGCPQADNGDQAAAEQSVMALDSHSDQLALSELMFEPRGVYRLSNPAVARQTILSRINTLRAILTVVFLQVECITVLDQAPYDFAITFDGCEGAGDTLDGYIRGSLEVEVSPCDGNPECIAAINYVLEKSLATREAQLDGTLQLRVPVRPLLPDPQFDDTRTSSSSWMLTYAEGATLALSGNSSWRQTTSINGLTCVEFDWNSQLTLNAAAMEEIGTDIELVTTEARDMRRCYDRCPEQGQLSIAFGRGEFLTIDYDGTATARAIGPRGIEFDIELGCVPTVVAFP